MKNQKGIIGTKGPSNNLIIVHSVRVLVSIGFGGASSITDYPALWTSILLNLRNLHSGKRLP